MPLEASEDWVYPELRNQRRVVLMLRIIQCSNALAAKGYFSAKSEYYGAGEQEMVGLWGGSGADELNLSGLVDQIAFDRLCDNRHPHSGERLTARMRANRRVGYDFNFHACKSASILYGVTADPSIVVALRSAVAETMREMESGVRVRVRKRGQFGERTSSNMVWAEYVHFTARPVAGVIDPHLHIHCFVPNCSFDRVEGIWKAIDVASIQEHAPHWQERFQKRFGQKLEQLGYSLHWHGNNWEVAGFTRETIERFSNRTHQVHAEARARGITDAKAVDKLGAKTRERKHKSVTMDELRTHWRHRLNRNDESAVEAARVRRAFTTTHADGTLRPYGSLLPHQYRQISGLVISAKN